MADPLLLPLRPSVRASPTKDSLKERIEQINKQKGGFRHVTEASLLEEIENEGQSDSDVDMDSEDGEDAVKPEDRQALLWKGREAMLQQIDHARNETLTALDFISALLSKEVTAAQASVSPVLKEAVPVGSLEYRTVKYVPASAKEQRRFAMTRRGWKMDSFAAAAEKISAAGSRLQEEAERETRYWEQISNLKAKGWAVSRLPRESRTVCVHFGLAEAAPAFRNRGLAILRRDQDGNVSLDRSVIPPGPPVVTVTVSINGQETGTSAIRHSQVTERSSIEDQIIEAHQTLSEEELFHEISREGRLLANQGVEVSTTKVQFEFGNKFDVQIRLVNPETEPPPANSDASAAEIAKAIAISLRILLGYAHQQNHRRRSNAPSPMTLKAKPTPEYAILRPLMSHLQHTSNLDFLRSLTASVLPPLSRAGIDLSVNFKPLIHRSFPAPSGAAPLQVNDLLGPLTVPLESMMTLELPTKRALELTVRTFAGHPVFGTEFNVKPLSYGTKNLTSPRLETVADVEKLVCHVIMVDLAAYIERLHTRSGEVGKTEETSEPGASLPAQLSLRVTDLHHGELSLRKLPQSIEKLQVRVRRDRLGLRHVSKIVSKNSTDIMSYVWEAGRSWKTTASDGPEGTDGPHLSDVVEQILQRKISDS